MFGKWFGKNSNADAADKSARTARSSADSSDSSSGNQSNKSAPKSHGQSQSGSAKSRSHQRKRKPSKPKPAWDISQFQVPEKPGATRFHDLELPLALMHAVADLGFEYCSPIQAAILPHTLDGLDAVGKAQTGTGKTAAFLITAIADLLSHPSEEERFIGEPRVVVIAPTRELVMQIAKDAQDLVKHTDLQVEMLIGGVDYAGQQSAFSAGSWILWLRHQAV